MRDFQCLLCKRLRSEEPPTCDTFPKGIPVELWSGKISHEKPFRKEDELLFEPIEEVLRKNSISEEIVPEKFVGLADEFEYLGTDEEIKTEEL